MKNRIFILFISSLFIVSCSDDYLASNKYVKDSIAVEYTTYKIPIDSLRLPAYYTYYLFKENDNIEYIYGYNKKRNSIDIFNISNLSFNKSITLDVQGPSGVYEVAGIFVQSKDSIFLFSRESINIINSNGDIVNKVDLSKISNYSVNGELAIVMDFKMEYNNLNKTMYLYSIYPTNQMVTKPIITEFNYTTQKLTQLPIYYSQYFKDNPNTGFLTYLNKGYSFQNNLIYNFEYESNIYVYDKKTHKISVHGGKSKFSRNLSTTINDESPDTWQRHAIENTHFFGVMQDSYRPFLYRFHWGNIEFKNSNTHYNSFIDKPLYLMVFNKKFEIIEEIELPKNKYGIRDWSIAKEGILMMNSHPSYKDLDEHFLKYDIIKVLTK